MIKNQLKIRYMYAFLQTVSNSFFFSFVCQNFATYTVYSHYKGNTDKHNICNGPNEFVITRAHCMNRLFVQHFCYCCILHYSICKFSNITLKQKQTMHKLQFWHFCLCIKFDHRFSFPDWIPSLSKRG